MKPVTILRAGYLASYVQALRSRQIDPLPLLSRQQLPSDFAHLTDYMIPGRAVHAFILEATSLAPPGQISMAAGLHHASAHQNPFREGAVPAINLLGAIERHNELVPRYGPGSRFDLKIDGNQARWRKVSRSPIAETEIFCVANLIGHVRQFIGGRWLPDTIEVGVAEPATLERLPELGEVPIQRSDHHATILHMRLEDLWAQRPNTISPPGGGECQDAEEPDFIESLRLLMTGFARTGDLSVERVARAADLSIRTLQRRLFEADISYTTLADQARFTVASDLLANSPELNITEIGLELGYSDPGSFSRAFRRFSGLPPAEFRQQSARSAA